MAARQRRRARQPRVLRINRCRRRLPLWGPTANRQPRPNRPSPWTRRRTVVAASASKSGQAASIAQSPRPAAASADKSAKGSSAARPVNGSSGTASAVSAVRPATPPATTRPAALQNSGRAVPGAGQPYPPLSVRLTNGADNSRNNKHLTPRSPRTALEPDTVDMPPSRSETRTPSFCRHWQRHYQPFRPARRSWQAPRWCRQTAVRRSGTLGRTIALSIFRAAPGMRDIADRA